MLQTARSLSARDCRSKTGVRPPAEGFSVKLSVSTCNGRFRADAAIEPQKPRKTADSGAIPDYWCGLNLATYPDDAHDF